MLHVRSGVHQIGRRGLLGLLLGLRCSCAALRWRCDILPLALTFAQICPRVRLAEIDPNVGNRTVFVTGESEQHLAHGACDPRGPKS